MSLCRTARTPHSCFRLAPTPSSSSSSGRPLRPKASAADSRLVLRVGQRRSLPAPLAASGLTGPAACCPGFVVAGQPRLSLLSVKPWSTCLSLGLSHSAASSAHREWRRIVSEKPRLGCPARADSKPGDRCLPPSPFLHPSPLVDSNCARRSCADLGMFQTGEAGAVERGSKKCQARERGWRNAHGDPGSVSPSPRSARDGPTPDGKHTTSPPRTYPPSGLSLGLLTNPPGQTKRLAISPHFDLFLFPSHTSHSAYPPSRLHRK